MKNKLPKVFKRNWIKALRSGEYKQGRGVLKSKDNTYCCLGVAAAIVGATCLLGKKVIQKGNGIRGISKIPRILIDDGINTLSRKLVDMNDDGASFEEIADYIEKEL